MIVNEQVNEQQSVLNPDPKVNIQKAKDFIIKLYKDGGRKIDEKRALFFAKDPNLKNNLEDIYRSSGNYNITPKDKGLSIYNSFLYEEESNDVVDEKKKSSFHWRATKQPNSERKYGITWYFFTWEFSITFRNRI